MNPSSPLLALCMIVKNEAENLPRCLDSVKDIVDEIIIVDTGSIDSTVAIAQSYGAKVYPFQWVEDFSAARNFGIEKASAEWILVLDADEALDKETKKILREVLRHSQADAYHCILRNVLSLHPTLFYHDSPYEGWVRVFRNRPEYRFEGTYHEVVIPSLVRYQAIVERSSFVIWHYGPLSEKVQGGETSRRERAWYYLRKAAEEEPNNGNLLFYLGVEYYERGDFENAYQVLKRATFEVGTELANAYHTKLGLIYLGEIAYQREEYSLASGCAKGSLALKEYPELNSRAWLLLCKSFLSVIQQGVLQATDLPDQTQRHQRYAHYLQLLGEMEADLRYQLNWSSTPQEQTFFSHWLAQTQRLTFLTRQAIEENSG